MTSYRSLKRPPAALTADLGKLRVLDAELWAEGPPYELFARLRSECPVHWSRGVSWHPNEAGFWSVTRARDVNIVSRDWRTYSSECGFTAVTDPFPLELMRSMFLGMDPPRHDRIRMLFQTAFTASRIAAHEPAIRAIVREALGRLDGHSECDLVSDVARPVVARVIGSFMGLPRGEDEFWSALMTTSLGPSARKRNLSRNFPEIFSRCERMIAVRREHPTDDLTSVLVHASVDGERLTQQEIVMGFFLLLAAGNDSTKATYGSGMRALLEEPEQRDLLLADPKLIPSAVEESLRMFPAFSHFRRTATRPTELGGQSIEEGDKVVMWYVSSNRDESLYEEPDRFRVRRNPQHQAFGGGGRHFCLGAPLARLELRVLFEETLKRFPNMELSGKPAYAGSAFINQLTRLPVALGRPRTARAANGGPPITVGARA